MLVYGVSFSSAGLETDCMLFLKVQHHECSFVPHLLMDLTWGLEKRGQKKKNPVCFMQKAFKEQFCNKILYNVGKYPPTRTSEVL